VLIKIVQALIFLTSGYLTACKTE